MALFVLAVNKGLCATFRTVFIVVGLVYEQSVHTQLLKSYHIVFSPLGLQLFQSGFQRLTGTLQLLYGKTLAAADACTSAMPSVISSICS